MTRPGPASVPRAHPPALAWTAHGRFAWILPLLLCFACTSIPRSPAIVDDPLYGHDIVVLIFVRTDCPIANRYAPTIRALNAEHSARGVRFVLVYPDADATTEIINKHRHEFDLPLRALRDPKHIWVERTGVTVTPEVAVFDGARRIAYRGRIDDRFPALGSARSEATVHDLDLVLVAMESSAAPPFSSQLAIGCPINSLGGK